jgi:hypothetical protein
MPAIFILAVALLRVFSAPAFAADADAPKASGHANSGQYELLVIYAKPGKLDRVHDWLRAHQDDVLSKHGATNLGFLVPAGEKTDNTILCLHKPPSFSSMLAFSKAAKADPLWAALDKDSNSPDVLASKTEMTHLTTTDYSPEFKPVKSSPARVFELRTFTCPSPEKLAYLHERFRDHTMTLFQKHGMENVVYFQPRDIENADRKLGYFLAHKSQDAAKESFAAFRKDPDWLAAREASEKKAGGSLTEKEGGVLSEFFVGTEYSPLRKRGRPSTPDI